MPAPGHRGDLEGAAPHIRRAAPEVLATAKGPALGPAEVLRVLLTEEVAGRDRSVLATRRARAAFPTGKTFDAWDEALSSIRAPTQAALRTLEWIGRHENLVVCGPSGTGKTFLLEALGQAAAETGRHVAWFTLESLGVLVRRHRADDSLARAIGRILRTPTSARPPATASACPRPSPEKESSHWSKTTRAHLMAATGQIPRPSAGRNHDRHWAGLNVH
jgi:hypothetical protein